MNNRTRYMVIAAAVVIISVGIFMFTSNNQNAPASVKPKENNTVIPPAGDNTTPPTKPPNGGVVINPSLIEEPAASVDNSALVDAGCVEQYNSFDCSKVGLGERYSCENLIQPSKYLGLLSPKVPIVECFRSEWDENLSEDDGILYKGCMRPIRSMYIILDNNDFTLLRNADEFVQFFGPVESPEEALGFAVALGGDYPDYNLTLPDDYRYFVPEINATSVKETTDGFLVNLFDYMVCGCGPHSTYATTYLVKTSGEVTKVSSIKAYENPEHDGLCVD